MTMENMSPKIKIGSRSCVDNLLIDRSDVRDREASYIQKTRAPNSDARLRSTAGCGDVIVEPYKLQRLLPPVARHNQ